MTLCPRHRTMTRTLSTLLPGEPTSLTRQHGCAVALNPCGSSFAGMCLCRSVAREVCLTASSDMHSTKRHRAPASTCRSPPTRPHPHARLRVQSAKHPYKE
eukprot:4752290-Prymnesium_polylepis.1